jgi:hypothetical protein
MNGARYYCTQSEENTAKSAECRQEGKRGNEQWRHIRRQLSETNKAGRDVVVLGAQMWIRLY